MTTRDDTHPSSAVGTDEPEDADARTRDRRVVRRALRAAAIVAGVLGLSLGGFGLATGGGSAAVLWIIAACVVGTLVASAWLVLALLLDLIAGEMPGRRRLIVTGAMFALAFISPMFLLAAELTVSGA